ncbi:3-phenylpropionate/cinnamic acid dioxygenase subunit beta [Paraburkholderia caffeinilytica]|uniref:Hypothetical biphenyl dioxygenase beta subunit n=1 Tax=Paraburkholderia caffeinilytica TaxID=1761016 RepID=A0ABQ1LNC1_9BURK|nr:3-phenylpropionate/cinnamic acid dioxygenase subunit beta [Paraburkholderia caffeinilytica]GGC27215.1 hypothetical biphenyl dioxygenase beta subunit [Paraburkholderia caffeinilytica]CAB3780125.1 Biphenyl dioxygenase subunit beta [Paraburkholderia caffeinilytica]
MNDLTQPVETRRVPHGSPIHNEAAGFLIDEAALLDHFRLAEWLECLTEDISYSAPLRVTRMRGDPGETTVRSVQHFDDSYRSLQGRVYRLLNTKSAWAEDPVSRTRRFVTNVAVSETDQPDEYDVVSYFLLLRNRFEETSMGQLSGERHDRLRRVDGRFKLARREIIVDMSVLGMSNLAVFL